MESYDFVVVCLIDHDLCVAVLISVLVEVPFKRLDDTSVCDNIVSSEMGSCVLFTVSTTTIFDRGEDSGWDIFIAHKPVFSIE